MLVDAVGKLVGLFTDSDLARLIERRHDAALDQPIEHVMAKAPTTVLSGSRLTAAVDILSTRKFSELPVVDPQGRPIGMIDVTDVVGLLPQETMEAPANVYFDEPVEPFQPLGIRLYTGDDEPNGEFEWPYAELPETD
jgi:arabinose-5-phosphate isomerase